MFENTTKIFIKLENIRYLLNMYECAFSFFLAKHNVKGEKMITSFYLQLRPLTCVIVNVSLPLTLKIIIKI